MKHTPGNWEAEHHRSEPPSVKDDPGYWTIEGEVLQTNFGPVADTLNRHHCISPDEDRANAALIAAAPDLLAALRVYVEYDEYINGHEGDPGTARLKKAREAIAKATS